MVGACALQGCNSERQRRCKATGGSLSAQTLYNLVRYKLPSPQNRKIHVHSLVLRPELGIQYTHTHTRTFLSTIELEFDTHISPLSLRNVSYNRYKLSAPKSRDSLRLRRRFLPLPPQNRAIFKAPTCAISSAKKIASERRFSLRLKGTNLIPTAEFPVITESAAKNR